jgi:hypothetical protein
MDFTSFSQNTQKGEIPFPTRPSKRLKSSQIYPRFAQNSLEVFGALQCSPRGQGRRGRPDSGEAGGGDGRVSGGKWSRVRKTRFERSPAAELVSVGGHGVGRRRPPLEESLRRAGGSAWPTSECGTFVGTRGR